MNPAGLSLGDLLALAEDPRAVEQRRSQRTAEWAARVRVTSTGPSLPPGEDIALPMRRNPAEHILSPGPPELIDSFTSQQ